MNYIAKITRNTFSIAEQVIRIPINLIGSKTWSIQELIARIPLVALKRLFIKNNGPLKDDLFPNKGHLPKRKITKEKLMQYVPLSCTTAFADSSKPEWVEPFGYRVISPKELDISDKRVKAGDISFFDPKSGLKVTLIEKENEVVISFGAINPGKTENVSKLHQGKLFVKGLINVGRNCVGNKPEIYSQADSFVKKLLKHPNLQGKEVTFTGMCYGGTIAQYVALKNEKKALCLNTLPLGSALQNDLGPRKLEKAKDNVVHILATTDFVSDPRIVGIFDKVLTFFGIRTPGNFGKRFVVPSAYNTKNKTHKYILGSIMQHIGFDKRSKPADLIEAGEFC